jgi:serine/threonine-protein kinase RsbT
LSRRARIVEVTDDAQALLAVGQAEDLARTLGFSEVDQTKIAIATSELARNIVMHAAGKGRVTVKPISDGSRTGIEVIAEDEGPGIRDLKQALHKPNSPKGLGIGLGGARRLMDEFDIETRAGEGTKISSKKWKS